MRYKRPFIAIVVLLGFLLLLAAVGIGASSGARAQTGHTVYLPRIERDTCLACGPKPTPTPRMWQPWDEPE